MNLKTNKPRKNDLIEEFQDAYEEALVNVNRAAETAATDGWQQMYCQFMNANKAAREMAADGIEQAAESLRAKAVSDDGLKDLKTSVKDAVEACDAAKFFDAQTVAPIRGTVEKCHAIIAEFEGRAEMASLQTPLVDGLDIAQRMGDAIAAVKKPSWNAAIGFIRS